MSPDFGGIAKGFAAEEAARIDALKDMADDLRIETKIVITALIKVINYRIPNNPITKAELVVQIKHDLGIG